MAILGLFVHSFALVGTSLGLAVIDGERYEGPVQSIGRDRFNATQTFYVHTPTGKPIAQFHLSWSQEGEIRLGLSRGAIFLVIGAQSGPTIGIQGGPTRRRRVGRGRGRKSCRAIAPGLTPAGSARSARRLLVGPFPR